MADVQSKDTAVGSHGVGPPLHLYGAAPRVRVEERLPAHRATTASPPRVVALRHPHPQLDAVEVVLQGKFQVGKQLRQLLGEDEAEVDPDMVLPQLDQRLDVMLGPPRAQPGSRVRRQCLTRTAAEASRPPRRPRGPTQCAPCRPG